MGRRLDALPPPIDQADTERMLHLGNRLRYGRLRHIELARRLCHAAPAHDGIEQAKVAQLETVGNTVNEVHEGQPRMKKSYRTITNENFPFYPQQHYLPCRRRHERRR